MADWVQRFGASQRQTCTLSRFSRTVYRYESIARDQSALEMSIKEIAKVRMHYGAPRVYVMLRREGGRDNHGLLQAKIDRRSWRRPSGPAIL
ncbi:transposase [Burkholderia pseudomallei]|nr:transposase [Burkholderia pseudomallei]OMR49258.1 transposase [Burkholderia pseudomallei]OMR58627.1 transposase [Burkholderia pseudomallei]OMS32285.1 transposase [Burkholderia pseudomallei]OMT06069.1 transposase [Burkholderia pseudomallei]